MSDEGEVDGFDALISGDTKRTNATDGAHKPGNGQAANGNAAHAGSNHASQADVNNAADAAHTAADAAKIAAKSGPSWKEVFSKSSKGTLFSEAATTVEKTDRVKAAFKDVGYVKRGAAAAAANFGQAGKIGIVTRGGITLGSAFVATSGLKDIGRAVGVFSPKVDADGKEIKPDAGTAFTGIAKATLGGAGVYYAALKGGLAKAISH